MATLIQVHFHQYLNLNQKMKIQNLIIHIQKIQIIVPVLNLMKNQNHPILILNQLEVIKIIIISQEVFPKFLLED